MRTQKSQLYEVMIDLINKMVVCDIHNNAELSQRKYKLMMALDDAVEANWADYIFSHIMESM